MCLFFASLAKAPRSGFWLKILFRSEGLWEPALTGDDEASGSTWPGTADSTEGWASVLRDAGTDRESCEPILARRWRTRRRADAKEFREISKPLADRIWITEALDTPELAK